MGQRSSGVVDGSGERRLRVHGGCGNSVDRSSPGRFFDHRARVRMTSARVAEMLDDREIVQMKSAVGCRSLRVHGLVQDPHAGWRRRAAETSSSAMSNSGFTASARAIPMLALPARKPSDAKLVRGVLRADRRVMRSMM